MILGHEDEKEKCVAEEANEFYHSAKFWGVACVALAQFIRVERESGMDEPLVTWWNSGFKLQPRHGWRGGADVEKAASS